MDAYKNTTFQQALNWYLDNHKVPLKWNPKYEIPTAMYNKRIKIFIIISAALLVVCLLRLAQLQLLADSSVQKGIAELKRLRGTSRPLKTLRGRILDRKDRILAADEPQFQLNINYELSSFADDRFIRSKLLSAAKKNDPAKAKAKVLEEVRAKREDLQQIIDKCTCFGLERADVENRIRQINDRIWNLRSYLAWKRSYANQPFEQAVHDPNERLLLTAAVDIAEMHKTWRLLELKTDDDIFTAQLEFMDIDGVQILPKPHRVYYYGSAAAQTIGWVGPPQKSDKELFKDDILAHYLPDENCGREDGVEYVCETILRGRRGLEVYDIDSQLIDRTESRFGTDVSLTIDIELQMKIRDYMTDCSLNPNCKASSAAVVIDVESSDILALVSLPTFDLNRARYDYDLLINDPNKPLLNRTINEHYPPGSVVKPLILIAGLEAGKITPEEIISCPPQKADKGWPSCWLYNRYKWLSHDIQWQNEGGNTARNAVRGSCNIYFSRLAERIEPDILQRWLFDFGYGRIILQPPAAISTTQSPQYERNFRQANGIISSDNPDPTMKVSSLEQLINLPLKETERRQFGIGQGNLRVTPLQVANSFAAIARGGLYENPVIFNFVDRRSSVPDLKSKIHGTPLNISPQTLDVVYDGMGAVVSELNGTANKEFEPVLNSLAEHDVKVYGKTGSTEKPAHAWFAGFAADGSGRKLAIAVIVEGGQHGSSDAAPLARDIIQFCIDAEYIGNASLPTN